MLQRATVLAEKQSPRRRGGRDDAEMPVPARAIPVDLRKVVAPYRSHGRLSIRVERMPAPARFSAGRNNGDNSWSFTLDELEDLLYLPGAPLDDEQMLAVRIVGVDSTDAATIAVLDYAISPEFAIAMVEPDAPSAAALEQLRGLRDELAQTAIRLAAREADLDTARNALGQLRAAAASAPEDGERAIRNALSKAEESWKAGEAARFATAQARWREQSDRALAEARAQTQKTTGNDEAALQRLNAELAALREQLAVRDVDVAKLQAAIRQAGARQERNLEDALQTWKTGEAVRLQAVEAHWKTQMAEALAARDGELGQSRASIAQAQAYAEREIAIARTITERETRERYAAGLADAVARYEAAEAALGEMRVRASANHAAEISALRDEISTLRTVIANRESENAQLRLATLERDGAEEPSHNGGLVFSALALACVVMSAILFYPQIVSMLPYDWQVDLASLTGAAYFETSDAAPAIAPPPPAAAPAQQKAVVARSVNLRADASTTSGVLATLTPGIEVATIRTLGNWTLVEARAASAGQKAQQGWVYNSFLKPKDTAAKMRGS